MTARVIDLHDPLRALARKLDLIVPASATQEEVFSLIASRVKELGWPKKWPLDGVHGPFDAHGTYTMYARGCRCPRCKTGEKNRKDKYVEKPSLGFIPTLLQKVGRRMPVRTD